MAKTLTNAEIVEKAVEALNKKFKKKVIFKASEMKDTKYIRRPTGITSLDAALAGGFPGGTVSVISGQEGVGKDALLNRLFKRHQQIYGDDACIFLNANEPSGYDKLWARKHGVRVGLSDQEIKYCEASNEIKISPGEAARLQSETGTFILSTSNDLKEVLNVVLGLGASGACHLAVINSVQSTNVDDDTGTPTVEVSSKDGMDKARLVTSFLNQWDSTWTMSLVIVQQARANISTHRTWGSKDWTTRYGARSLLHAKSIDVELRQRERIYKGSGDNKELVGKIINWELTKGKSGTHDGLKGSYSLYFEPGIDTETDLLETLLSLELGTRERDHAFISLVGGDRGTDADLIARFRSDPNFFEAYYKLAMAPVRKRFPFVYRELA